LRESRENKYTWIYIIAILPFGLSESTNVPKTQISLVQSFAWFLLVIAALIVCARPIFSH
jgi:hypothetical protein